MNYTIEEETISHAFHMVMNSALYIGSRRKRYRIMFFSYMFGCVHIDDVYFMFLNHDEYFSNSQLLACRNKNRALLNYLADRQSQKPFLKKLENGHYILTTAGLNDLLEHLIKNCLLPDSMVSYFTEKQNRKTISTAHASACGWAVLSFIRAFYSPFIIEPPYNNKGMRTVKDRTNAEIPYLYPDAAVYLDKYDEITFIEADRCTERLNSELIPKLKKYQTAFLDPQRGRNKIDYITIHFFISTPKDHCIENQDNESNILESLQQQFDYLSRSFSQYPITFSDFLHTIKEYDGKSVFFLSLKRYINDICLDNINCMEDLYSAKKSAIISSGEISKQYITRKKTLLKAIDKTPAFKKSLESGNRFICTPLRYSDYILPCIYIEQYDLIASIENALRKKYNNLCLSSFKHVNTYINEASEESFYLRNIYTGIFEGQCIDFAFENISDDLSGYIRVRKILNSKDTHISNLILVCVFRQKKDVMDLYSSIPFYNPGIQNIPVYYISYADMLSRPKLLDINDMQP